MKTDWQYSSIPLAERLRPETWQEVIGQNHLLGAGKPLQQAFQAGKPHSMIFWGPPGVGKTSLAKVSAKAFDCQWLAISAVLAGVKDIRNAIEAAEKNLVAHRQTVLFIDEIHRFNKAQQDALLPFTESGLITIIGATTENPSFAINSALLSRTQVYVLNPLTNVELQELSARACAKYYPHLSIDIKAEEIIIAQADGDARKLLNLIEQIFQAAELQQCSQISFDFVQAQLSVSLRKFDKHGDYFYDQISALHKAVRGSHPDAALYWLCRMLDGGVDAVYLARRIIRMAWEDIGLADPRAIDIANAAALTYDRLGSPEGELALAEAVIYLALSPKSNAGYLAYKQAMQFVKKDKSRPVPHHLRNVPSEKYRYAHDEPHAYAAGETYLPERMLEPNWYQPVERGLEIKLKEKMDFLRQLDKKS